VVGATAMVTYSSLSCDSVPAAAVDDILSLFLSVWFASTVVRLETVLVPLAFLLVAVIVIIGWSPYFGDEKSDNGGEGFEGLSTRGAVDLLRQYLFV
jgi:hypothetical protein